MVTEVQKEECNERNQMSQLWEVFTVNESQYAELLSQVRTAEFDKELHDRMRQELALAEQRL